MWVRQPCAGGSVRIEHNETRSKFKVQQQQYYLLAKYVKYLICLQLSFEETHVSRTYVLLVDCCRVNAYCFVQYNNFAWSITKVDHSTHQ